MSWYFFESQNRELRTSPSGFGTSRISDITWSKDWAGQPVKPGDTLATVTWAGGVSPQVFLVAPPGCEGTVGRTFDVDLGDQARSPSQILLYLT